MKLTVLTSAALLVGQSRQYIADALEKFCRKCFQEGLEEGHASRDPEVADLKAEIEAERKRGDAWAAKADTFDWDRQTLDRDLKAERETVEKLKAENKEFFDALCGRRPSDATPGHSPEGETLFQKSDKETHS